MLDPELDPLFESSFSKTMLANSEPVEEPLPDEESSEEGDEPS